jgi:hypothetical protein
MWEFYRDPEDKNKEERLAPISDGPRRECLEGAVRNKERGRIKQFVWRVENQKAVTERDLYGC